MRFSVRLKNFSFSLALISLALAGVASAQSLTGTNARLDQRLDSRTAKVGQVVTAKLDESVKNDAGMTLPRGTELVGKVAAVSNAEKGAASSISLVFTSAKLKSGKEVPVKVTLLGAYPPVQNDGDLTQAIAQPPQHVNSNTSVDQEPGALNKVALTSAVKNADSGTFRSTDGNFRLNAGTYIQVGIGPAQGNTASSAAE